MKEQVLKIMLQCWEERNSISSKKVDQERMWYLYDDGDSYSNRLLKLTEKILTTNA